jgi:lipopolysaccharide export system protein LptA
MLAKSEPVHVTARNMNAQRGSKIARYTGGARIWQGANIVEAPTLEFNQAQRTVTAEGTNQQPVKTVFLQVDKDKKATPVTVTALRLNYIDAERRARYTGGVVARGQDLTLNADHADVFLRPATGGAADAPSQLQQIVAEQRVVIASQDRRGVGEKLVYTAQDGSFVLTGGPPTITDPERGTIRGDSLTFYTHDDRVIVESAGSSRTITHTRIGKR